MKTYPSSQIRNVVLVGHGGAGKTTLAEAMLLRAGAISRVGAVMDHDPEEKEKGFSMSLALAQFEWRDHKINLLDTPGFRRRRGTARLPRSRPGRKRSAANSARRPAWSVTHR